MAEMEIIKMEMEIWEYSLEEISKMEMEIQEYSQGEINKMEMVCRKIKYIKSHTINQNATKSKSRKCR